MLAINMISNRNLALLGNKALGEKGIDRTLSVTDEREILVSVVEYYKLEFTMEDLQEVVAYTKAMEAR